MTTKTGWILAGLVAVTGSAVACDPMQGPGPTRPDPRLEVHITDPAGRPIPEVRIDVLRAGDTVASETTDANGRASVLLTGERDRANAGPFVDEPSRITFDEHYVVVATTMARLRYAIPGRAGLGSVDAYTPRMTLLSQTFINDAALEAAEGISGAELDTMIEDLEGDLVKVLELEMRPGALPDGAVLDP